MWHVTCDTWHLTPYMWHIDHGGGWTLSENFRSLALTVWDRQCLADSEQKIDEINKSMNLEGVCRTAQATHGLLKKGANQV